MTTNAGRAIYIVYSLLTIPIITILVSLMSDTILSSFQKRAETIGIRANEDQRFREQDKACRKKGPRWKYYTRKLFRRKSKIIKEDVTQAAAAKDLEAQIKKPPEDEALKDEVEGEVENLERRVTAEVDSAMGIDKDESSMIEREIMREEIDEDQHPRRRTRVRIAQDPTELGSDDVIREEDSS